MEKKKNLINLIFSSKLLIIEWSIIIVFCVFIGFSIRGQCADVTDSLTFPLDFENAHALNNWYSDNYEVILNDVNVAPLIADSDYILIPIDLDYYGYWDDWSWWRVIIVCVPVDTFSNASANSNPFYSPLTVNTVSDKESYAFTLWIDERGNYASYISDFGTFSVTDREFFGQHNSQTFYNYTFVSSYPVYWGKNFYSVNDTQILLYTEEPAIQGHATPPDLTGNNIGDDKPDIDDYLPNIPNIPTLDNSSLEKIAESIFNILQWGFNAIKGTLQGLFEYLADTFTYSIQKVIDNIKNAIQNFYDNMVSLFEPLLNGIEEIAQGIKEAIENIGLLLEVFFAPFDEDQFKEAYENCEFINAVDGVNDSIEEFKHAFTYAEERDYYTLYLGFIMDGYTVNYDLDFTWLYPLRQYYRPIIWAVVIYEFFVYLCSQLSDYLQGRSGK